jgi:hypothetical protein
MNKEILILPKLSSFLNFPSIYKIKIPMISKSISIITKQIKYFFLKKIQLLLIQNHLNKHQPKLNKLKSLFNPIQKPQISTNPKIFLKPIPLIKQLPAIVITLIKIFILILIIILNLKMNKIFLYRTLIIKKTIKPTPPMHNLIHLIHNNNSILPNLKISAILTHFKKSPMMNNNNNNNKKILVKIVKIPPQDKAKIPYTQLNIFFINIENLLI